MLFVLFALLLMPGSPTLAATCYGDDPCRACSSCGYCAHCNSGGNPCGVLKALRGITSSSVRPHRVHSTHLPVASPSRPMEVVGPGLKRGEWIFDGHRLIHAKSSTPKRIQGAQGPIKSPASEIYAESPDSNLIEGQNMPVPALPVNNGPPCVWQLSVIPSHISTAPDCLVHFNHWTDMQPEGRTKTWDNWATNLLHLIYTDIKVQPGTQSSFENCIIYVRSDRKIMLKDLSDSRSGNIQKLQSAVDQLNGRSELAFPTPLLDDTVSIICMVGYAPERVTLDVWGRPQAAEVTNRNRSTW